MTDASKTDNALVARPKTGIAQGNPKLTLDSGTRIGYNGFK